MKIISLQLEIFIIIIIGYIFARKGIITKEVRKKLTDIVIDLILPCAIIKSFMMKLTPEIIRDTVVIFIVSFIIQLSYSIFNRLFYNHFDDSKAIILKYATIVSNAGFMGLPIVESIYGQTGLLYASIALIPQRIFMWSAGLSLFTQTDSKSMIKKVALHPCIIAVYVGIIFMIIESIGIILPTFMLNTISAIGGCTTALSMLIIGAILKDVKWSELVEKSSLYYSSIRLLIIPITIFICLSLCHMNSLVIGVSVLLAAMPAGSTAAMLAQKYDQDVIYASKIIVVSTMLSLITLPMISILIKGG